jgi:hypothetical protein
MDTFRPMARSTGNPKRWRKRAAEIRALAGQVRSEWTRVALLHLAADYDRKAEDAERRNRRGAALGRR